MAHKHFCGLDFGTSNSTVACRFKDQIELVPVEGESRTLPSAIFFDFADGSASFGRAALKRYVEGAEGRLMRSLKSVLGGSLMDETTRIKTRVYSFKEIIGLVLARLKAEAERASGGEIERVVLGRPVHFVDDNPEADRNARDALEEIARAQGFREIAFQYEPIAAALAYERTVLHEQYALIADIGGGTSDFSVVRVSPEGRLREDRSGDVLANRGVHIGGTDIDRLLSLRSVMPLLGSRSERRGDFGHKILPVPNAYFVDLATWHRINFLYKPEVARALQTLLRDSFSPELIERLISVVENKRGHSIALAVEAGKIELSARDVAEIDLAEVEPGLVAPVTPRELEGSIADRLGQLEACVKATLESSGLGAERIDVIFLTGGSTAVPAVRRAVTGLTPQAKIVEGDLFGAVGIGLGLDAQRKFG
jgi:hypothetical chaperone protein